MEIQCVNCKNYVNLEEMVRFQCPVCYYVNDLPAKLPDVPLLDVKEKGDQVSFLPIRDDVYAKLPPRVRNLLGKVIFFEKRMPLYKEDWDYLENFFKIPHKVALEFIQLLAKMSFGNDFVFGDIPDLIIDSTFI